MITHWELMQKRKEALAKEQYRLCIKYYKTFGVPVGKLVGESWTDYVLRVTEPPEVTPVTLLPLI